MRQDGQPLTDAQAQALAASGGTDITSQFGFLAGDRLVIQVPTDPSDEQLDEMLQATFLMMPQDGCTLWVDPGGNITLTSEHDPKVPN